MITLEEYLMGRQHSYKNEYSGMIEANAIILLSRVNQFLISLGNVIAKVTSGWRPPSYNSTVKGAAKRSLHQIGLAVDLADPKKELSQKILADPMLLELHDLYLEAPLYTPTWVHLQARAPGSGRRIFIP